MPTVGLRLALAATFALLWRAADAGSGRDYLNVPVDSWLGAYNATYADSVTPEDAYDITARVHTRVLAQSLTLSRTMDFLGRTGGVTLFLPYRRVEAESGPARSAVSGVSDVGVLWQINIFGGPALSRAAFANFVPQTFSSFHLYLGTPLGSYDATRALNPSANRWTVRPTVNYSYTPDRGWTWLETYVTAALFSPNDSFQAGGASRLTQAPLFILEGHASRNVLPRLWLSADAYYNVGGETSIDAARQHNAANTLRLGGGSGLRMWRGADLILNGESVVAKPTREPYAWATRLTLRQFW